ncbi:uncharacterized protein LOC128323295 isoform X2 [Hemicordylus capensis]|uniref:uncharacterized protein LOC128323295 isoform X2 n=1 Tax=Hemicordylus capensis TaxID=884348 RepID=UPI0023037C6B|nr:uncharacterized protein LOC128323295 isoform X2 [Hemicordylus capensis]
MGSNNPGSQAPEGSPALPLPIFFMISLTLRGRQEEGFSLANKSLPVGAAARCCCCCWWWSLPVVQWFKTAESFASSVGSSPADRLCVRDGWLGEPIRCYFPPRREGEEIGLQFRKNRGLEGVRADISTQVALFNPRVCKRTNPGEPQPSASVTESSRHCNRELNTGGCNRSPFSWRVGMSVDYFEAQKDSYFVWLRS